jgi:hypothetical protein
MYRTEHKFPTRSFPYRKVSPEEARMTGLVAEPRLEAGKVYRLVVGLDTHPTPMSTSDMEELLRDPFAELLLRRGTFPLSLRSLLNAFEAFNGDPLGLPEQDCYLVADGGHIPYSEAPSLDRSFRLVITRARGGKVHVLISASTVIDSEEQFLQLLAWDLENRVYNFYERRAGTWAWAGNSHHALEPPTRGEGPFDSHVNGALVMKELKHPWTHWHSMSASIHDDVLKPDDPLRSEPLFREKAGAEDLEKVVKAGIFRWNKARLDKSIAADGAISDVPYFMRQVLETTVNLISSESRSGLVQNDSTLQLPITFFLNRDALLDEPEIGLEPDIGNISVDGRQYLESLKRYDFALQDGDYQLKGDTFFAFLVPEPAFEDLDVLSQLLERKILTPQFAASLLMVDFPNPIFSARREHLMRYVPTVAYLSQEGSDLPASFVVAIEAVEPNLSAESPEKEFLANWRLPAADWKPAFEKRIEDYFHALAAKSSTQECFDGLVRLADSRRREFRKRPLAEFQLTLPTTNIPKDAPLLAMSEDGTVQSTSRRPI